jgi:hypothetical protein
MGFGNPEAEKALIRLVLIVVILKKVLSACGSGFFA